MRWVQGGTKLWATGKITNEVLWVGLIQWGSKSRIKCGWKEQGPFLEGMSQEVLVPHPDG